MCFLGNRYAKGVSDISSEEGNLKRFSRICSLLEPYKPLTPDKVRTLINNRIGLTNKKVIERHLRLLELLGIIERTQTIYVFTGIGRVFCEFLKDTDQSNEKLQPVEKNFYFERLFSPETATHFQLCLLLKTISLNSSAKREPLIIAYFRKMKEFNIWKAKVIDHNLRSYEKNQQISPFFDNRFRCQQKWIETLGLMEHGSLKLTEVGERVEQEVEKYTENEIWTNPTRFELLFAFDNDLMPVSTDTDESELTDMFKEACERIGKERRARTDSVKYYMFYRLLNAHKYFDDLAFLPLLNLMVEKNVIESVMRGRDGKIHSVTLRLGAF